MIKIHLIFSAVFFSLFFINCRTDKPENQPNIILIMADDLGYGGIGCFGNQRIRTPNLDLLAENGLKFTDFHSNGAVCSPTRAALMTGQYQQRSGMEGVIYARGETRQTGLDTTATTIAKVFSASGYRTGIMGKWHLGYGQEYNPVYHGFDEFYGYRSGNVDYHSHYDNTGVFDWYHNLDTLHEEGYVTGLITDHSIEFISNSGDSPFFLFIAHEAPHVPFQGPDDPAYRFPDSEFTYFGPVEDRHRAYREMVESMDKGIGELMNYLRNNDLLENTLIFFFSDNGGLAGYGDNGILNGAKGNLYEGGQRVPGIAYWEGKIVPGISNEMILTMDLFPTVLSVTGIHPPEKLQFDGIDFSPVLLQNGRLPKRNVFWRYRDQLAMRNGELKLLIDGNDTLLFNLETDLEEQHDLSKNNMEIVSDMLQALTAWETEMDSYNQKTR